MKKIYTLAIACFLYTGLSKAQSDVYQWASRLGNNSSSFTTNGTCISVSSMNVISGGGFRQTVDFDPSANTYTLSSATNAAYLTSLDTDGNFIWAKMFNGSGTVYLASVATDNSGQIYITGYFDGAADFDPGSGTTTLSTSGLKDLFMCKLDAIGNLVWANKIGGAGNDEGKSITVDAAGNVYVTGLFKGTVDFDPGVATSNMASTGTVADAFVAKFNSSGALVWNKRVGGTSGNAIGRSVTVDGSGNVVFAGSFTAGNIDIDPGAATVTNTSAGGTDGFIVQLDASGNYVWGNTMGTTNDDQLNDVKYDNAGNILALGTNQNNFSYGALVVGYHYGGTTFYNDAFVLKLSSAGTGIWAANLGGNSIENGTALAIDAGNNIYVTGDFVGSNADFDPGASANNMTSGNVGNSTSTFLVKLSNAGGFSYSRCFNSYYTNFGSGIAYHSTSQSIFTTGSFVGTVDFDPDGGVANLTASASPNGQDAFIHRYGQCIAPANPTNASTLTTICANNSTTLSATGMGTINWYATSTSTAIIGTGISYTTPSHTAAGTYTYYAQATTCTVSPGRTAITVTVNASPSLSITSTSTMLCSGNSATISVSGTGSYTWSTSSNNSSITVSPTSTSNYTVTGENLNGCRSIAVFTQSVSPAITLSANTSTASLCVGQTATLTASATNATTFNWSTGGTTASVAVSPTVTTTYTIVASNAAGCSKTQTITQVVSTCTGTTTTGITHSTQNDAQIILYPNPSSDILVVETAMTDLHVVSVINALGEVIYTESSIGNSVQLTVSGLTNGIYFIKIESPQGSAIKKFIKH